MWTDMLNSQHSSILGESAFKKPWYGEDLSQIHYNDVWFVTNLSCPPLGTGVKGVVAFRLHIPHMTLDRVVCVWAVVYSCFKKDCLAEEKSLRDNVGSYYWYWLFLQLLEWTSRCFSVVEGNSTNKYSFFSRSLLLNRLEPQKSNAKLLLPTMPIGIAAYTFTLSWDDLCRNSCINGYQQI